MPVGKMPILSARLLAQRWFPFFTSTRAPRLLGGAEWAASASYPQTVIDFDDSAADIVVLQDEQRRIRDFFGLSEPP